MKTNKKTTGRPTKLNKTTVGKLEQAFAIGASITTACQYTGISRDTYYEWCKQNKRLSDKFNELREQPLLKALATINNNLNNPKIAQWYLERKAKQEFGNQIDITSDGEKLEPVQIIQIGDGLRVNDDQ